MFQSYTESPGRSAIFLRLKAAATWLVHLGIFTALLWQSARGLERPPAAGSPLEHGYGPDTIVREEYFQQLPLLQSDSGCTWPGGDVMPFVSGQMTPPVLIYGNRLRHTARAFDAHVSGLIIARCTITCRGEVTQCSIRKGLPHMDQAAILTLESRRYLPVLYQGRPITMQYNFHLRLEPPEPRAYP
jgi:Gram-negative bacterial TonB protein C-terminal